MSDRTGVDRRNPDDSSPDEDVINNWDEVVASMSAIDEEYREEGWSTLVIHPGNVAALGDRDVDCEFDILVPDNEFETFQQWMDGGTKPSEFEVYKNSDSGVMYAVVVTFDPETSHTVIFPLHYDHTERSSLVASAESAGVVRVEFRPLTGDGFRLRFDSETFFEISPES